MPDDGDRYSLSFVPLVTFDWNKDEEAFLKKLIKDFGTKTTISRC